MGGRPQTATPETPDTTTPDVEPTTFTSTFPELEGQTFNTQAELDAAEAQVLNQRQAGELREAYQEKALGVVQDPESITAKAEVTTPQVTQDQLIQDGVGQAAEQAAQAGKAQAAQPTQVATPADVGTAVMTPATVGTASQAALDQMVTPQGQMKPEALIDAVTRDPSQLAALGLSPAQINDIRSVISPDRLVITDEMIVSGSAVDMARVEEAAQIEAAQANPSAAASVRGQLELLYQDFDAANPPPWASGAMRAATARMAARGLGASSMAGQAIVQSAMEAATPIAMADAQIRSQFEAMNLSNRQQAAMYAAEQRASFLKMEFDQGFQTRVLNASRIADVAGINFTAEQQVALENARLANTVDLANLSSRQAKVMSDAAAMSQLDMVNLSHQQMAAVDNAKSFLQMDLTNLSLSQQSEMFKAQAIQQALLTDTAARNASQQFNASSENQTRQFMANLKSTVEQFNSNQSAAMDQFNVSQENAVDQFNAQQENLRDQFNAQNGLIIAQANTKWRQDVATLDTVAQNEANMELARTVNAYTGKALDEMWQRERDLMQYAFQGSERAQDRAVQLTLQNRKVQAENSAALGGILAKLVFSGLTGGLGGIFG